MNSFVFHNNFHLSNHHTVSSVNFPESSKDPIASIQFPFQGIFYNNFYNLSGIYNSQSTSYNWWSSYVHTQALSSKWNLYPTTYTTVCSNSSNWNSGFSSYLTLKSFSGYFESTYDTLCSNIVNWNQVYNNNIVLSNQVQQYTKQKNSTNFYIYPIDKNNITLDLNNGQVTTYIAFEDSTFQNAIGQKKGGIYHLIVVTNSQPNSALKISFNSDVFKFFNYTNTFSITGSYLRKFQFVSDGVFLHGKFSIYDINEEQNTFTTPTPTVTPTLTPTPTITPTPTLAVEKWILYNGFWNDGESWKDDKNWV